MSATEEHKKYLTLTNLGGRPPRFSKEELEEEAEMFLEWLQRPTSFYFKHFCTERGYPAQYLTKFAQTNDRFREVYEYAKTVQETKLMMGGLINRLNSGLVKFALVNHHGMSDKQVIVQQTNNFDSVLQNIDGRSKDIVNDTTEPTITE